MPAPDWSELGIRDIDHRTTEGAMVRAREAVESNLSEFRFDPNLLVRDWWKLQPANLYLILRSVALNSMREIRLKISDLFEVDPQTS